ncbi:MAG TPA: hypothetical protein VFT42_08230 [Solirubrobacteraceae bacterium]|nr:hypothetical protein [Solirubrobacteraceae bacterium]
MSVVLQRVVDEVRAEGGLLAQAVLDAPASEERFGRIAAAGPRSRGREEDVAFVVEAIREGYLLHYGRGRLLTAEDDDLALLAGDRLYALGLARLARLGDVEAVGELADVISLCAQAHAAGDGELAAAAWEAGVAAVGWGGDEGLREAKAAARDGAPGAASALQAAARRIAPASEG